ncbi:hypothetical protein [Sphingomonas sp. LHG3406-1]|uniref:hypothetical protein n=1 Tax=Sphingomonas sp. LHG3406-1 TaxID=2804617 RepID=UPI002620F400|nr:hypothetical protein [Sphingomonas sp. LHG3406-1]
MTAQVERLPPEWSEWLIRGWHGITATEWAREYMPRKLASDLSTYENLEADRPRFARALRRQRRNTVADLLRFQHHLPWDRSGAIRFFREATAEPHSRTEKEHALPVSQLKSLVLMALEDRDQEQALRRLWFGWLCPTIEVSSATHRLISKGQERRCTSFDFPLSRYRGIPLIRFDGVAVDASTYSIAELLRDLGAVPGLEPIVSELKSLELPTAEEEELWTRSQTRRGD